MENAASAASRPVAMRTSEGRRGQAGRIVDVPTTILEGLEDGMEIHRREARGVDGGETGGYARRSAQSNAKMREVSTRAHSGEQGVLGGVVHITRPGHVADPLPDPLGNGGHMGRDIFGVREFGHGEPDEVVTGAVATGTHVELAFVAGRNR